MEIRPADIDQANDIFLMLRDCKYDLDKQGIFQWTDKYPALHIVESDIEKGSLYCAILDGKCIGAIGISEEQDPEYQTVRWHNNEGKILVIHRLAVDPLYQGQGIARTLMDFAEQYASDNQYSSIRLDAFSDNKRVLRFYENRGYVKRGEVFFEGRVSCFFCYEKEMS